MILKILSREVAIALSKRKDLPWCAMISIQEYGLGEVQFHRNVKIKDILRLYFDDVPSDCPTCKPMTTDDAQAIALFVTKHRTDIDMLFIHCHAGISRSAGIAAAISLAMNGDDSWVWNSNKYYPNTHCYNLVLQAFGINKTPEDISELWQRLLNEKGDEDDLPNGRYPWLD